MADAFIHYPSEPPAHIVTQYCTAYIPEVYNKTITFPVTFDIVPIVVATFGNSNVSVGTVTKTGFTCNCSYAPYSSACTYHAYTLK